MSGHSKWATTKRAKGAADAKRGAIFTKLANAISIAAKLGGGNPDVNFRLRLAIDRAKGLSMPKDNIERAIKRGTGEGGGGPIENIIYEGFGPDGIAVMIDCLTDNRNRTSSDIKHILTKFGGNLGGPGAVAWLFEQKGLIRINQITEELELELIDQGASDIQKDEDGVAIYTQPNDLQKIKTYLDQKGINIEYAEIEQVAKEKKELTTNQKDKLQKMYDELDENEDVNDYYSNAEFI